MGTVGKGEGIFTEKKILKIILDEEDDDILAYFPEYKVDFDRIRRLLSIYITDIKKSLKEAENRLKLDRKEYAKAFLKNNPDIKEEIEEKVREKIGRAHV